MSNYLNYIISTLTHVFIYIYIYIYILKEGCWNIVQSIGKIDVITTRKS